MYNLPCAHDTRRTSLRNLNSIVAVSGINILDIRIEDMPM